MHLTSLSVDHPMSAHLPTTDDTLDPPTSSPDADRRPNSSHPRQTERDRGQATTEYALVLLAAALVAVLVIGWATSGGGAAAINRLFNAVINSVIDKV